MRKFLFATALALVFMTVVASAQTTPSETPVIVTRGEAMLKRPPDRAWVSIAVESREGKAADARRQAATQMATVQAAVKTAGIAADAIKTTDFSLQTQSDWDGTRNRISGYVVHNEIEVRVDSIDRVSDVIDAAASVKSSNSLTVTISGVRFDLKNMEALAQETLGLAVKDGMARAQAIAAALGRTLGAVMRVEDQRQAAEPRFSIVTRSGTNNAGVSDKTPIAPNEIEIRTAVSLTVRIQ